MRKDAFKESENQSRFADFLKNENISMSKFCDITGLSRCTVYRAYHGKMLQKRVAKIISEFSNGKLTLQDFDLYDQTNRDYSGRRPRPLESSCRLRKKSIQPSV